MLWFRKYELNIFRTIEVRETTSPGDLRWVCCHGKLDRWRLSSDNTGPVSTCHLSSDNTGPVSTCPGWRQPCLFLPVKSGAEVAYLEMHALQRKIEKSGKANHVWPQRSWTIFLKWHKTGKNSRPGKTYPYDLFWGGGGWTWGCVGWVWTKNCHFW